MSLEPVSHRDHPQRCRWQLDAQGLKQHRHFWHHKQHPENTTEQQHNQHNGRVDGGSQYRRTHHPGLFELRGCIAQYIANAAGLLAHRHQVAQHHGKRA